jgi:hypothetical protein
MRGHGGAVRRLRAITFAAAPGANVTLSGQSNGFTISGRSWIMINGFNVTKTSAYGILLSDASHITISNNHVSYAGQPVSGETRAGIRLDFGDGSAVVGPQSAPTATHTFLAGGTYYVTVTVTDTAGLSSTATRKIKIK